MRGRCQVFWFGRQTTSIHESRASELTQESPAQRSSLWTRTRNLAASKECRCWPIIVRATEINKITRSRSNEVLSVRAELSQAAWTHSRLATAFTGRNCVAVMGKLLQSYYTVTDYWELTSDTCPFKQLKLIHVGVPSPGVSRLWTSSWIGYCRHTFSRLFTSQGQNRVGVPIILFKTPSVLVYFYGNVQFLEKLEMLAVSVERFLSLTPGTSGGCRFKANLSSASMRRSADASIFNK